ncbi:ABC transporter permease [Parafilimonas terrae]|uniref:Putative ABC transport system permease protein n=1 Tax=Parafilimonas terrae TaxID=1465490 RepID=A0A1I5VQJ6_9BACT|nr:ABC transporter permease [Parafilimonas terrae]SFQ09711.1 putative ABC transport system permease protein [Parafilimonas terrae]
MFKNYLTIAWRNLKRNKIYAFINIAGLSIGLACAMLILLYVKDEVSFDRFHNNVGNIYRIVSKNKYNGQEYKSTNTGFLQGSRFTQNVPGIKTFVRVQSGAEDIKTGTDVQSQDLLYVDSSFFNVFTFPLIAGNPQTCLKEPRSIVISEDMAKKQFGTTDAVGKVIMIKEDSAFQPYKVTAVARRSPQNSSIRFEALLPFKESADDARNNDNWYNFFLNTFVVLQPSANLNTVNTEIQKFYVRDAGQTFKEMTEKYGGGGTMGEYFLQPYIDIHMNPELGAQNGMVNGSNPTYAYILSGIALFVLLIACINFINLTVARSVKRAKEIGIRKVVGGERKQLILQFLGESFLLCTISFLMAIWLVILVLPLFNNLANKALAISYLLDAKLVGGYIILYLLTGILAGFYPALVLSGYKPVDTLYSRFNIKGKNYLQKSLVVLQFTLASFLIIATFTIYTQFNYLTTEDLGYDDSNLVILHKDRLKHTDAALFKNELLKNSNILGVSAKNGGQWGTAARNAIDTTIQFAYETVDEHYIPLLKIPLLQGRNFSKDFPADSTQSVIVNESFVKKAGWKTPIGQTVNFWYNNNETYTVIGVVKDYHFASLNQKIGPQLFTMKNDNMYGDYYVKIKPGSATASLKWLRSKFKEFYPLSPYTYKFKDDDNKRAYDDVAKWKQIMLFSAFLTIFISCIGLFGLSVLSAEKRTKEIGIRKVLGASVNNVAAILSKDFLKLVAIALIVAVPAAYMAGDKWLQNYPYRITQSWWLFAGAALLVIMIALITVSFQAIKAAMANPVKSLRTE